MGNVPRPSVVSGQSVVLSCGAVLLHSASPLTHSDVPSEIPSEMAFIGQLMALLANEWPN